MHGELLIVENYQILGKLPTPTYACSVNPKRIKGAYYPAEDIEISICAHYATKMKNEII